MQKLEKPLRPRKIVDYEDITIDFYNSFVAFLSNEGYSINTMGRFIKVLKYMMKKALNEKRHNNKEFQEGAFSVFSEDAFTVYLTEAEVEKIYNYDLSKFPRMELARDAFIVLCETALRISDYTQIELNIREKNGKQLIYIYQQKTGNQVIIPLTRRMNSILHKYNGKLPRIPEQYVNKHIKAVCLWCGITEELNWTTQKFGKKYSKSAKKYELISCHSGRRTACTLMYLAGIPTIDIMKISGHISEGAFMRYIRVTAEETALQLAEHPYFNGLKKVN
jgi:integrase